MRFLPYIFLCAMALGAGRPCAAAPITWADISGLCAGNSPCFTSVGDAVANAGPAPAQVFIFPGTYAEAIDLGSMGSDLADGAPGELALVSVDAGGLPAPGAVIDPGAPTGPGTGDAITAAAFPAPLTLDGLVVRSPDLNGIFLTGGMADVRLVRLDASGSLMGNGAVVLNTAGAVTLEDSTARLNNDAGFNLGSLDGSVAVSGCLAERNGGAGYAVVSRSAVVTDSSAEFNGDDGWAIVPPAAADDLTLTRLVARGNDGRGISAANFNQIDRFALVTATDLVARDNAGDGILLFGGDLTLSQILAEDNGNDGLIASGENFVIDQVQSARNADIGTFLLVTGDLSIQNSSFADNLAGGLAAAAIGEAATASGSGLVATGNTDGGIFFADIQDGFFAEVDLFDLTAIGNPGIGIGARAKIVTARQISAIGNDSFGFSIEGEDLADASFVDTSGNSVAGIGIFAVGEVRLADSTATGDNIGIAGAAARQFFERVTASMNGPSNGNPGSGGGFVFLDAVDLEVADAVSEQNDFGWIFLDLQTSAPATLADAFEALGADLPERLSGSPGPRSVGGPLAQRIVIETSRTVANSEASMVAGLSAGGSFRVSCSDFVGNGPTGLELLTAETVNARANYWGAATGPTHPNNPGGTGDVVNDGAAGGVGVVEWVPFLTVPATADDCPEILVAEIPALPPVGLALFALALTASALLFQRRKSRPCDQPSKGR